MSDFTMRPTDDQLCRFLLGTLHEDESDAVLAWVESAPDAAHVLEQLNPVDPWDEVFKLCQESRPQGHSYSTEHSPSTDGGTPPLPDPPTDAPSIPGYHITAEIGQGGMGKVFAAVQFAFNREVAIKTLLPGAPVDRFITESQITAQLPHPNIPPVHELGKLTDGTPFLVMKLVRGTTLSKQLKARPNPTGDLERFINIFEKIAEAVGFAHSKGVIHRDLKPLNIMVGEFREVQVMDWGLGKKRNENRDSNRQTLSGTENLILRLTTPPDLTEADIVMGTPGYMAPEQARGQLLDARADVFALGSILAMILTGEPALVDGHKAELIRKTAAGELDEVRARLDRCGADDELVSLAKNCLTADRQSRMANGQAVADAVAAYRTRADERAKRAQAEKAEAIVREAEQRKRRRAITWAGGVIAMVLLLGLGVSLWQMLRAMNAESAKAQQLVKTQVAEADATNKLGYSKKSNAILGSVFENLDPKANYETVPELRDALKKNLKKAVADLNGSSIGDPLTVAEMQNQLGLSLLSLGDWQSAITLFEKAIKVHREVLGIDDTNTLICQSNLASAYQAGGQYAQALPLFEDSWERKKSALGADHPTTLNSMNNFALCCQLNNKPDVALPLYEEALRLTKARFGPRHSDTIGSMGNLAGAYRDTRRFTEAISLFEATLKLSNTEFGKVHPSTINTINSLAGAYDLSGEPKKAFPLYQDALERSKSQLGLNHPTTIMCMNNVAGAYKADGQLQKALTHWEETMQLVKDNLGRNHPNTLLCMRNLAVGYKANNQWQKALPLYIETLDRRTAVLGRDVPNTMISLSDLASGYREHRQYVKALPLYVELLEYQEANNHPDTLTTLSNLAYCYDMLGQYDKAIPLYERGLERSKAQYPADHPILLLRTHNLATAYQENRQFEKAIPLFERNLAVLKSQLLPDTDNIIKDLLGLGRSHFGAGNGEKAIEVFKEYIEIKRTQLAGDPLAFASQLAGVSFKILQERQYVAAEELLRKCLKIREDKAPEAWSTFDAQSMLGGSLLGQKKYQDAEPLLIKGYEGLKKREKDIPKGVETSLPEALDRLIELYAAMKKPDEVKKYQELRAMYPPGKDQKK